MPTGGVTPHYGHLWMEVRKKRAIKWQLDRLLSLNAASGRPRLELSQLRSESDEAWCDDTNSGNRA